MSEIETVVLPDGVSVPDEKNVIVESNIEDESDSGSEIDMTENPLYQVLSVLFENDKGDNIAEILDKLVVAVNNNTRAIQQKKSKKKYR